MNTAAVRPVRFWLLTGLALLVMSLTASLGMWQLDRASQKRALAQGIAARESQPRWANETLLARADDVDAEHRLVELQGRWVTGTQLFLDNRPMAGRTGFIALAALRLSGSDRAVLVQRGWVPRDFLDRKRLPDVPLPEGDVRVLGRLAPPPSQLFEFDAAGSGPIRQNVQPAALAAEWRIPLLAALSVLQTGGDAAPLQREWPRFAGDEHKHLAYAAQWFAMCAGVAALYLWFQIIQPRLKRRPHGQAS